MNRRSITAAALMLVAFAAACDAQPPLGDTPPIVGFVPAAYQTSNNCPADSLRAAPAVRLRLVASFTHATGSPTFADSFWTVQNDSARIAPRRGVPLGGYVVAVTLRDSLGRTSCSAALAFDVVPMATLPAPIVFPSPSAAARRAIRR